MADEKVMTRLKGNANFIEVQASGAPWEDPYFRHDASVLTGLEGKYNWLRASQIFAGREKVYDSFSGDDIEQGDLGDCYLLSAMSALAEFPGRVQKLFPQRERNPSGCYPVNLFVSGQFVQVVIDDYFPVNANKKPAFAGSKNLELWVMLLEKAWAKVHGAFAIVEGGDSRESLAAITGAPVEYYKHKETPAEQLWEMLKTFDKYNYVMCTGADKDVKGIVSKHAYTLVGAFEFDHQGNHVRLLQVRNPWGCTEWTGPWGDQDKVWTPELNAKLNHVSKDDGTFFIPFKDFYEIFIHSFVARCRDDFVLSGKTFHSTNVFSAFHTKAPIRGFVSAYQVSSRLGKSIIGKAYAIERLKIELYKVDGASFKLVKEGWQNAVGPAHLEVELEAGTYVVHATFGKSDVPFPLISLVTYADKQVDLAELKITDLAEATHEVIHNALHSIKHAFTTSEKPKLSCAFNACTQGHPLAWSTEPSTMDSENGESFLCENCRQTYSVSLGRWLCKDCQYDICGKCRPKELTSEEVKMGGQPHCPAGHDMAFSAGADPYSLFLCDKCGRAVLNVVKHWTCASCNHDLCRNCMPAPPDHKPETKLPEIDTCFSGHKLSFVVAETKTGKYDCSVCWKMGNACDGRWVCFNCGFNMCVVCKPNEQAAGSHVNAKTRTVVCKKGHMLYFTCMPPGPGMAIVCDKCEGDISKDNWRWNCRKCDYDVCPKCRPPPEGGRNDLLCPNMHMLTYSILPEGNTTYGRCDKCRKAFRLTDGRYCCTLCQYDLCSHCLPPEKDVAEEESKKHAHHHHKRVKEDNSGCTMI